MRFNKLYNLFILLLIITGLIFPKRLVLSQGPIVYPGSNYRVCNDSVTRGCANCDPEVTVTWQYGVKTNPQTHYWVQVDTDINFGSSPKPVDTGWLPGVDIYSYTTTPGALARNTTYYWRMAVRDSLGSESGWVEATTTPFTTFTCCVDCGLRVWAGSVNIIACTVPGEISSPIKFYNNGIENGVMTTDCGSSRASDIHAVVSGVERCLLLWY